KRQVLAARSHLPQTRITANKMNQTRWCGKSGAQKNLHLCRAAAFENPLFSEGASRPDYGSHYGVGLHAPDGSSVWLPAGTPSVRQKCRLSRTPQRFEKLLPTSYRDSTARLAGLQGLNRGVFRRG